MKNLKNIVATLTLTATLTIGSTVANAGIILSGDKAVSASTKTTTQCTGKSNINSIYNLFAGVLLVNIPQLNGIILSGDRATTGCQNYTTNGIILSGD